MAERRDPGTPTTASGVRPKTAEILCGRCKGTGEVELWWGTAGPLMDVCKTCQGFGWHMNRRFKERRQNG